MFFALSDPTRRRIIELLNKGNMTAGEIASKFEMSQPSISHHLHVLKEAGLITCEKQGQFIFYSLNTTVFEDVMSWILNLVGRTSEND